LSELLPAAPHRLTHHWIGLRHSSSMSGQLQGYKNVASTNYITTQHECYREMSL